MFNPTVSKRIRDHPPCDRCEERLPGCHGSCEKYQEWRRALTEQNEDVRSAKQNAKLFKPVSMVRYIEKQQQKHRRKTK